MPPQEPDGIETDTIKSHMTNNKNKNLTTRVTFKGPTMTRLLSFFLVSKRKHLLKINYFLEIKEKQLVQT